MAKCSCPNYSHLLCATIIAGVLLVDALIKHNLWEHSVLQDPVVTPRFLGWTDDASLLQRFDVEVYLLITDSSGILQQTGTPDRTGSVTPDLNNFLYAAPQPGVYAIVVTVYDGANNSARARKIFNYYDQPGFDVTDEKVYFIEGSLKTNRSFITTLDNHRRLTVNFTRRYVPKNSGLNRRVEPWPVDPHSIDDVYRTTFGLRSVDAVSDMVGVTNMSCVYLIDPKTGGRYIAEPQLDQQQPNGVVVGNCSTDFYTQTATLNLDARLQNGATVVVWLKASDHRGAAGTHTDRVVVTMDLTRPYITRHEFVKNRDDNYYS